MSDPDGVVAIVMPKWGLSMKEGLIIEWFVSEGDTVAVGDELAEVETDKINGEVEATSAGVIRRIVAGPGTKYRVQSLLAVLADASVDDAVIDEFIAGFPEPPEEVEGEEAESAYDTVTVAGLQVRYSRVGEGSPVLLLHGFGGDLDNWLFNIGALAEHASVLAVDLPGHGESSLTIPDPSPEGLARFTWSVLDELGIHDVALVGHSMGGAIASAMAIQQPDRVRSLALLAPAGFGPEINQAYIDGFVAARSKREMKDVASTLFADSSAVTRTMIDGMLRYKRVDGVAPLLAELRDAWFIGGTQLVGLRDGLAELRKPVLVIWGADDRVIPASHAAADSFATVHVIDGAGHMVQMERANEVNRLLVSHLAETHDALT